MEQLNTLSKNTITTFIKCTMFNLFQILHYSDMECILITFTIQMLNYRLVFLGKTYIFPVRENSHNYGGIQNSCRYAQLHITMHYLHTMFHENRFSSFREIAQNNFVTNTQTGQRNMCVGGD